MLDQEGGRKEMYITTLFSLSFNYYFIFPFSTYQMQQEFTYLS